MVYFPEFDAALNSIGTAFSTEEGGPFQGFLSREPEIVNTFGIDNIIYKTYITAHYDDSTSLIGIDSVISDGTNEYKVRISPVLVASGNLIKIEVTSAVD